MSYTVEIIDLLRGHTGALSGGGVDGRIIAVSTNDEQIRDSAVKVEGVATWEVSHEPDKTWLIYLAPAHGTSIFILQERVIRVISELARKPD